MKLALTSALVLSIFAAGCGSKAFTVQGPLTVKQNVKIWDIYGRGLELQNSQVIVKILPEKSAFTFTINGISYSFQPESLNWTSDKSFYTTIQSSIGPLGLFGAEKKEKIGTYQKRESVSCQANVGGNMYGGSVYGGYTGTRDALIQHTSYETHYIITLYTAESYEQHAPVTVAEFKDMAGQIQSETEVVKFLSECGS